MEIRYYQTFEDDFVKSFKQDYKIKDNYKWIHKNIFYKMIANIVNFCVTVIAYIYSKWILKIKVVGKEKLKGHKQYFVYGNHTQKFLDPLFPLYANYPRKTSFIVSPANLGIPVIGKLLPLCGALPIPQEIKRVIKLNEAIDYYNQKGNAIMIYPEAHLWEYYTDIRPFPSTSFYYPIEFNRDVFVFTTTYQKGLKKKPQITIYIDGPVRKIENCKTKREARQKLCDEVFQIMKKRSENSNYEYIKYQKSKE